MSDESANAEDAQNADQQRWLSVERKREWELEHEADRNGLVARAASDLLLMVVAGLMSAVFAGASVYGTLTDAERATALFVPMAAVAGVVCVVCALRYAKAVIDLRRFDRRFPREWIA